MAKKLTEKRCRKCGVVKPRSEFHLIRTTGYIGSLCLQCHQPDRYRPKGVLQDTKLCARCGLTKLRSDFYPRSTNPSHIRSECKDCSKQLQLLDRIENPGNTQRRNREAQTRRAAARTALTLDILKDQGGVCFICRLPITAPHLDHDHFTGLVRGILCSACNRGLGLLGDDAAKVKRALEYLQRSPYPFFYDYKNLTPTM